MIINSPWKILETFEKKPYQKEPVANLHTVLEIYKSSFDKPFLLSFVNLKWEKKIDADYSIESTKDNEPLQLITFKSGITTKVTENQTLVTMLWERIKAKDITPWVKIARFGKNGFIYDEVIKSEKPMVDYYENQKYSIKSKDKDWFIVWYDDLLLG